MRKGREDIMEAVVVQVDVTMIEWGIPLRSLWTRVCPW